MKKIYNFIDMIKHLKDAKPTRIINPTIGQLLAGIWLDDIITPPAPPVPVWTGLKFAANQDNSTITYVPSTVTTAEYSLDSGQTWVAFDNQTVTLNQGDEIYVRGVISGDQDTDPGQPDYAKFGMTGSIAASGNIMSLYNYTNFEANLAIGYDYAFVYLFEGCTSLTTPPQLPATTLTDGCYGLMFHGCTSLTTAPILPATTLADACYGMMFGDCTSLTTPPTLPATTLAQACYTAMFSGCTSMTTAPILPATTLTNQCYMQMFDGCVLLTTAPVLPATTLVDECYMYMFDGCTSLSEVTSYANDISATHCLFFWLNNVAYSGDFYNEGTAVYTRDASGVPATWTLYPEPVPAWAGLKFTANQNNSTILYTPSTVSTAEYSLDDGQTWVVFDNQTITLNQGDEICVRGVISGDQTYMLDNATFTMTGSIASSGNIMSLYNKNNWENNLTLTYNRAFICLFQSCTSLTTAPQLPATTLTDGCYASMFQITSLTTAPQLPATTLADSCYASMFAGCPYLITAPELPAYRAYPSCYNDMFYNCLSLTTAPLMNNLGVLATSCCEGMFRDCTSLVHVPEISTRILAARCYARMFEGCTSLGTEIMGLAATVLATSCYERMFYGCTQVRSVVTYAQDISAYMCLTDWLYGVSATGNFYNYGGATYPAGASGIPNGWTEHT